jgi:2-phosphosulfolactate phosphatase
MASPYAQRDHRVRLEWGPVGAAETAPHATYAVVVDVLSFTTTLSVAMDLGAEVLPYRWNDESAAGSACP